MAELRKLYAGSMLTEPVGVLCVALSVARVQATGAGKATWPNKRPGSP